VKTVTVTEQNLEDIETALNLVMTLANTQMSDDAYREISEVAQRLAHLFEIPIEFIDVNVDEHTGEIRISVDQDDPQEDEPPAPPSEDDIIH